MKILMAGDTHMDLEHLQYLVDVASVEADSRLFVLGDFGYWEHVPAGILFLDKLDGYAGSKGVTVYFLDGNHDKMSMILERYAEDADDEGFLRVRERIYYAPRGHRWTWDGSSFIALGGAYSVDKRQRLRWEHTLGAPAGSSWFPEEEMSDEDMDRILANGNLVTVILAHDKPRDSEPGWNRKDLDACLPNQERLQRAIEVLRPCHFFHGHLHHRYTEHMEFRATDSRILDVRVHGLDCNPDPRALDLFDRQLQSWVIYDTVSRAVVMGGPKDLASDSNDPDWTPYVDSRAGRYAKPMEAELAIAIAREYVDEMEYNDDTAHDYCHHRRVIIALLEEIRRLRLLIDS